MQDFNGILSLFPLCSNVWVPFCDTTRQVYKLNDTKMKNIQLLSYFRAVNSTVFSQQL